MEYSPYTSQWKSLRVLRGICLTSFAIQLTLLCGTIVYRYPISLKIHHILDASFALSSIIVIVAYYRLVVFRCPRCSKKFFGRRPFWRYFFTPCANCNLPIWSPDDPNKGEVKVSDNGNAKMMEYGDSRRCSTDAKIAAIYFIVIAVVGLLFSAFHLGPHHSEFAAKSPAWKFGSYAREYTFNILFLIAGVSVLRQRLWATRLAIALLVISTIYSGNAFAWGFAHGRPTTQTLLISDTIVAAWNSLWIFLLCRKPEEAKPMNSSGISAPS